MTTTHATVRPARVFVDFVAVTLALVAFAGVGFLVGRSNQVSSDRIASTRERAWTGTYAPARNNAYRIGWQQSYRQGRAAGIASATAAGTHAGQAAGRTTVAQRAAATHVTGLAGGLVAKRVRITRKTLIDRCVQVGLGLCEVLGPGATGKSCPTGSVPTPVGGATCIPRILLLAAGKS